VRFPFTFMGFMALGIGLWGLAYLGVHRNLDPVAQGIAIVTILISWSFAVYVLVRRVRRGPQL
jgi:EamA domain-containing membrane protein RarD